MLFLECVGDIFQKDQSENNVFVFRGVHVAAEFVGGLPEFRFETEVGAVGFQLVDHFFTLRGMEFAGNDARLTMAAIV